jgi:hypothetical protein
MLESKGKGNRCRREAEPEVVRQSVASRVHSALPLMADSHIRGRRQFRRQICLWSQLLSHIPNQ